jgi:hypothetical protein
MNKILNSFSFTQLEDTLVLEMSKKISPQLVVPLLGLSPHLAQEEMVKELLRVEELAVSVVA